MSGRYLVEFRREARAGWEEWGVFVGTRPRAEASARDLLSALRVEEGHARPAVRVNGKRVLARHG